MTLWQSWQRIGFKWKMCLAFAYLVCMAVLGCSSMKLAPMDKTEALLAARVDRDVSLLHSHNTIWEWATDTSKGVDPDTLPWREYLFSEIPPPLCGEMNKTDPRLNSTLGGLATVTSESPTTRINDQIRDLERMTFIEPRQQFLRSYGMVRALFMAGRPQAAEAFAWSDLAPVLDQLAPYVESREEAYQSIRSRRVTIDRAVLAFMGHLLRGSLFSTVPTSADSSYRAYRRALNATMYMLDARYRSGHERQVTIPYSRFACGHHSRRLTSTDAYLGLVGSYLSLERSPEGDLQRELDQHEVGDRTHPVLAVIATAKDQMRRRNSMTNIPSQYVWAASNFELVHRANIHDPDNRLEAARLAFGLSLSNNQTVQAALETTPEIQCIHARRLQRDAEELVANVPEALAPIDSLIGALAISAFRNVRQVCGQTMQELTPPLRIQQKSISIAGSHVASGVFTRLSTIGNQFLVHRNSQALVDSLSKVQTDLTFAPQQAREALSNVVHAWERALCLDILAEVAENASTRSVSQDEAKEALGVIGGLSRAAGVPPSEISAAVEFYQSIGPSSFGWIQQAKFSLAGRTRTHIFLTVFVALILGSIIWPTIILVWRIWIIGHSHYPRQRARLEKAAPHYRDLRLGVEVTPDRRAES